MGSRCLSRLQIFTPVCVQWWCVDLSVLDTPLPSPSPGCKLIFAKCFCPGGPPESPSSLWEQFLQGEGAVQSAARPCFYPKPWDGSLVFVESVLPGVKSKTKQWGIKWDGLGGGLFVTLSVYIHTPSVEMTLHGRENPPGFGLNLSKLVCVHVSTCMSVNWICILVCVCIYYRCVSLELSQETLNALTNVYILYIILGNILRIPPPWFLKKNPPNKKQLKCKSP